MTFKLRSLYFYSFIPLVIILSSCDNTDATEAKESSIILQPTFSFTSISFPLDHEHWIQETNETLNKAIIENAKPGDSVIIWKTEKDSLQKKKPYFNMNVGFHVCLQQQEAEAILKNEMTKKHIDSIKTFDFRKHGLLLMAEHINASTINTLTILKKENKIMYIDVNTTYLPSPTNPKPDNDYYNTLWSTTAYPIKKASVDSLIICYGSDTLRYSFNNNNNK